MEGGGPEWSDGREGENAANTPLLLRAELEPSEEFLRPPAAEVLLPAAERLARAYRSRLRIMASPLGSSQQVRERPRAAKSRLGRGTSTC